MSFFKFTGFFQAPDAAVYVAHLLCSIRVTYRTGRRRVLAYYVPVTIPAAEWERLQQSCRYGYVEIKLVLAMQEILRAIAVSRRGFLLSFGKARPVAGVEWASWGGPDSFLRPPGVQAPTPQA